MIYVALILLIYITYFILWKVQKLPNEAKRKIFIGISFSLMFLLAALRDPSVGTDTANYMNKFELIHDHTFAEIFSSFFCERVEIGYALINKVVGLIWNDPRAILIVNAAIIYFCMSYFIYNYLDSEHDLTSVLLFVCSGMFFYSFNVARQVIACVILLNAWGLLKEKKYVKSVLCFLLSITFHITAVCFIVAYIIYFIRNKRILAVCALVLGGLVAIFYKPIIKIFSQIIPIYRFNNENPKTSVGGIILVWFVEAVIILIYLACYFFGKHIPDKFIKGANDIPVLNSFVVPVYVAVYIITTFLGSKFNYFDRFGIYFLPFCIPMFENFGMIVKDNFGLITKEKSEILYKVYVVGLQVCFIALFMLDAFSAHHTYSFFW